MNSVWYERIGTIFRDRKSAEQEISTLVTSSGSYTDYTAVHHRTWQLS
jgi:hypothetical protein